MPEQANNEHINTNGTQATPVLVVGGGLVGLSAALFLAWRGVPTVLVERHPGSSPHPRAIGYTQRTLELIRAVGLKDRVPEVSEMFSSMRPRRVAAESLAGKWYDETLWTPEAKAPEAKATEAKATEAKAPEAKATEAKATEAKATEAKATEAKAPETKAPEAKAPEAKAPEAKAPEAKTQEAKQPETERSQLYKYSPCLGSAFAQDRLEPILRDRAIELGADVRLNTKLMRFEQDADGVNAWLRTSDGKEYTIRADYMVAADGHRSPVREALGITRSGRGHIRTVRSVMFRADLSEYLKKGITQFNIKQPELEAFLTTYGDGRWVLIFSDNEERDETTLRSMIKKAIGRSDIEFEIITTGRWEISALVADTFSCGRVFLAGDAAHTLPPSRGGYGANTGIEDVHNLAWKLASVVSGASTAELLNTYSAERRPIGWLRHEQIFARTDYSGDAKKPGENAKQNGEQVKIIEDDAMELGQLYRSSAVIGAGDELPPALRPDQWAGQPGTRAPHAWVYKGEEKLSTLDLFQRTWVLVTEDERWFSVAAQAGEALGIKLTCVRVGVDMVPADLPAFRTIFGLGTEGASLIRPDGYIAWRSLDVSSNPLHTLTKALASVSSAKTTQQ